MAEWNSNKINFYELDGAYLNFLRRYDSRVPESGYDFLAEKRKSGRQGIVVSKNKNMCYFLAPYSKDTGGAEEGAGFIRMGTGREGVLDFKFMVPVPRAVLEQSAVKIDFKDISEKEANRLTAQWRWVRQNTDRIAEKAKRVYTEVSNCYCRQDFRERCLNYQLLEYAGSYYGRKDFEAMPVSDTVEALKNTDGKTPPPFIGFSDTVACFDKQGYLTKQDKVFLNLLYGSYAETCARLGNYISPRFAETAPFVSVYDKDKERLADKEARLVRKTKALLGSMFNYSRNCREDYKGAVVDQFGGDFDVYRVAVPGYEFDTTSSAVYFSTGQSEAESYLRDNRALSQYKIRVDRPLIVKPGFTDWDAACNRWEALFGKDEKVPEKRYNEDETEYWNRLDTLCEEQAKEMGYDAIVTETPFAREVAFLGDPRTIELVFENFNEADKVKKEEREIER